MGLLTLAGIIAAIAFAFGERTAVACVQIVLIVAAAFFVYVGYRIVSGTI